MSDWWFLATGIGVSSGHERGREKKFVRVQHGHELTKDARMWRPDPAIEAYLRAGLAFGQ